MATGDVRGNMERVRVQLQSIQYPHTFDVQGLKQGIPAVILPILHYALLGYSRHVARFLSVNGYELYAKADLRFMEGTLKFLRQEFNYRSALTIAQMFSRGYAERKLLFIYDVIQMVKRKHSELLKLVHQKKFVEKDPVVIYSPPKKTKPGHAEATLSRSLSTNTVSTKVLTSATRCDSPNPIQLEVEAVQLHPRDIISKGSNISPPSPNTKKAAGDKVNHFFTEVRPSSSCTSTEPSTGASRDHDACTLIGGDDVSNITYGYLEEAQPCTPVDSEPPYGSHEDHNEQVLHRVGVHHEELCQKIMDMAERLEARFAKLEEGITTAKETLQERLVTLESRVLHLENVLPNQENELRQQKHSSTCAQFQENLFNKHLVGATNVQPATANMSTAHHCNHVPGCPGVENLQQIHGVSVAHQSGVGERVSLQGTRDISNVHQYNNLSKPLSANSQGIRDISNIHQCTGTNIPHFSTQPMYQNQPKLFENGKSFVNDKQPSNTQEFITGIKSRFNRTLELLSQDIGHASAA